MHPVDGPFSGAILVQCTICVHLFALCGRGNLFYTHRSSTPYGAFSPMALKPPPPPWEVLQQLGDMVGGSGARGEIDKSLQGLMQSALSRLDLVNREEFDAQAELLQRTRARVIELETALEEMGRELEALAAKR